MLYIFYFFLHVKKDCVSLSQRCLFAQRAGELALITSGHVETDVNARCKQTQRATSDTH